MRAVQFEQYGDPDVLHVGDAPDPHAGPGEVRIAVEAAGVNPFDWKVRSGMLADAMPLDLPHVPGLEAAGVVDEVGDGVVGVAVGDRVFGNGSATYAELAVLKAFAPIPGALTMAEAAALPVVGRDRGPAAGPARAPPRRPARRRRRVRRRRHRPRPARGRPRRSPSSAPPRRRTTTTCASSARSRPRTARGSPTGCTRWSTSRWRVRSTWPGKGAVPDLVGAHRRPGPGGHHRRLRRRGAGRDRRAPRPAPYYALGEVARLVEEGRFRVTVDEEIPWTEAARAHERSESGHVRGKLVLAVG